MDFCWDVISKNANFTLRVKKCLTDILLISFKFFAVQQRIIMNILFSKRILCFINFSFLAVRNKVKRMSQIKSYVLKCDWSKLPI